MQPTNISNDIWVTILSYLKDETTYPVNPDQFIAIMKMSFVNKTLRNIITSNTFWILYNSNEYAPANYNIYNCNINFCQIMHKIIALKTEENITNLCDSIYTPSRNIGNILNMVYRHNAPMPCKYNLSNKEIVNSHAILNNKCESSIDLRCYNLVENDYCILFKGISEKNGNMQSTSFFIKKPNQFSCNDKFTTLSDFYDNATDLYSDPNQRSYNRNATLHDNYIWLTTNTVGTDDINFYAINVMTNVKYLVTKIKDSYGYISYYFDK